jgi:hypothetical protein
VKAHAHAEQIRCSGCANFDRDEQWRALPLVQSMSAGDLVPLVTTHWNDRVIEVRRCTRCGRHVARLAPARRP